MAATPVTPFKSSRVTGKPNATPVAGPEGFVACDATEGNTVANTGRQIVLLKTGAAGRTVDFKDGNGNVVTTVTLAEKKVFAFGPFDVYNYGSTLNFKASNVAVEVLVITLNEAKSVQVS
jgi:hypothetical protein